MRHDLAWRKWGFAVLWHEDTTPQTVTATADPVRVHAEVVHVITELPPRRDAIAEEAGTWD